MDFINFHQFISLDYFFLCNFAPTLRSAAEQATRKFGYAQVGDYKTAEVKRALDLLILAGLLIPVTHTSANGLPLGSGADNSYRKIIPLDCALTLRLLNMTMPDSSPLTTHILTAPAVDLVNKGAMAELVAGLELLHYQSPHLRHEMFYWTRQTKNSLAEITFQFASIIAPIISCFSRI